MTAASHPITTRSAVQSDMPAISALSAAVFGPGRFVKTAYRVREGTPDISGFCRVALLDNRIIAAIRMTEITVGGRVGALMLGPLAVDPEFANLGYGRRLIAESQDAARSAGRELVLLVGDTAYYCRLGYVHVPPGQIILPGPVDPARLLAFELKPGTLGNFRGLVAGAL